MQGAVLVNAVQEHWRGSVISSNDVGSFISRAVTSGCRDGRAVTQRGGSDLSVNAGPFPLGLPGVLLQYCDYCSLNWGCKYLYVYFYHLIIHSCLSVEPFALLSSPSFPGLLRN